MRKVVRASLVAQPVRNLPAMQEVPGLGRSPGERNGGNGSGREGKALVMDMFLELWGCGPELELTCQKGGRCSLTSRLV